MKKGRVAGAAVAIATAAGAVGARRQRSARRAEMERAPADVGFMLAMHAAMRRDLDRLVRASRALSPGEEAPPTVTAGFSLLRRQLEAHRAAEDEDLWPPLVERLQNDADRAEVAAMPGEHARNPPALDGVQNGLAGGGDLRRAADDLASLLRAHLDHEERTVLPLVERHLTHAEWRRFLLAERAKHSARERIEFLAWVLDDASAANAAAVFAEVPLPARLVHRYVLRRLFAARHLWAVGRDEPEAARTFAPSTA